MHKFHSTTFILHGELQVIKVIILYTASDSDCFSAIQVVTDCSVNTPHEFGVVLLPGEAPSNKPERSSNYLTWAPSLIQKCEVHRCEFEQELCHRQCFTDNVSGSAESWMPQDARPLVVLHVCGNVLAHL